MPTTMVRHFVTATALAAGLAAVAPPALDAQVLGSQRTPGPTCVYYQPPGSTLTTLSVEAAIETIKTTLVNHWFTTLRPRRIEVTAERIAGFYGRREEQVVSYVFREMDPRLLLERSTVTNESFWSGKMVEKEEAAYVLKVASGRNAGWSAFTIEAKNNSRMPDLQRVTDAVYALHANARMQWSAEYRQKFDQAVPVYTKMATKPELPEEARRYAVQGRALTKDGDLASATAVYENALDIAPWWAEGHFNLALAYEAKQDFPAAIVEMKRYLTLEPRAQDARDMQDKIYEWELRGSKAAGTGCGGGAAQRGAAN